MMRSRVLAFVVGASLLGVPAMLSAAQQAQPKTQAPAKQTQQPRGPAPQGQGTAQQAPRDRFAGIPQARAADVASPEAVVAALYSSTSGAPGARRDWGRFRSLFYPGARLLPTGTNPRTRRFGADIVTPEAFVRSAGPALEAEGYVQREIARRVQRFGNVAHILSTFETRRRAEDQQPFRRGINSIQLVNDGSRWWIANILWSQETPQNPIPPAYLRSPPGN